jgi:hypothetical protein
MAKKYKDINYDQYVAFINTVVQNTVQSGGYEYKRFWATFAFAMIFMNYKPTHFKEDVSEEGKTILINEEWNEIKHIDVLDCGYDPVIIKEMYYIIDKKLDKVFGKSDVETAVAGLIISATEFINNMDEKFKNENIEEQMKQISALSAQIKNMDSKTVAKVMAKFAHENGKVISSGETKASDA